MGGPVAGGPVAGGPVDGPGRLARRGAIARLVALTGAYTAGALLFLWPLPTRFTTHIWGDRFDAWTTLWLIWHLADRVRAGALEAVTDRILFPLGYNLWSFGHVALQAIGAGLVLLGVPLIPAYNLLFVGSLVTSALAAHAFGRLLGRTEAAGFVAALVFTTSPYLYGEGAAGCIELVAAGLLPLFAWALVHLARDPRGRRALIAAGILASIGPFNWYYTLFAGMFGLAFAAWQAAAGRTRAAAWMLFAFALAGAADAPLIPLVRRETPERPPLAAALFTDPAAWERARDLSDGRLPITDLDEAVLEEHDAMQVVQNSTRLRALLTARFVTNPLASTPGALAYIVGIAGAIMAGRRGRGWLLIAAGATVLTLGPYLMVDETPPLPEWSAAHPLPYAWAYENLPFFSKAYRPYRIGVVALLALSGGAAAGVGALWPALRDRRLPFRLGRPLGAQGIGAQGIGAQGIAAMGIGALSIVAFAQPLWAGERPATRALADATVPPIYTRLRDAGPGAVIELPLQYQPLSIANARFQYHQVVHEHALLNCNQLIRRTDLLGFRDYVAKNALLSTLLDLGRRAAPLRFADRDVASVIADGFRWLVVHRTVEADDVRLAGDVGDADLLGQPAIDLLRDTFGAPALADDDAWVFHLPDTWPDAGRTYTWTGENTEDIATPYDVRTFGLQVALQPGQVLPLWAGPGRASVSFWARAVAGEQIVVRPVAGEPPDAAAAPPKAAGTPEEAAAALEEAAAAPEEAAGTPIALAPGRWQWVEVDGDGGGFSLTADAPVTLELTRLQVVHR